MAVIYTIAHPFTNEIVYVGCCKSLNHRASVHTNSKTDTDISRWIQSLKDNFMLPKIESIDVCDESEALVMEEYWIHQLTVWGFSLLNKYKTIKLRVLPYKYIIKKERVKKIRTTRRYIKKTPEQWAEERKERAEQKTHEKELSPKRNKKWDISSFDDGKTYEIGLYKLKSFKEMLRQYAKFFKLKRHFTSVIHGETATVKILEGERNYLPSHGKTKGGYKRYKPLLPKVIKEVQVREPKLQRYHFKSVKPGDSIYIKKERLRSFVVSQCLYNRNNDKKVYYNKFDDGDKIRIDFISKEQQTRFCANLPKEDILNIYNDSRSIREIAKAFGYSYSAIWNVKAGKTHTEITNHINQQTA